MAALTPNERCFVLESYIFFLLIKTEQAKSGTSAATYKVLEPHYVCIKEALKLPRAFSRLEDFTNTFNYRTEREAEIFQVKVYGLIRLN